MTCAADNETIIRSVLSGSREEFGFLVERYLPMVHAIAHAHLGSMGDVDDVAQDAFVRAFRFLHTLQEPAKFPGWLARITRNTCSRHTSIFRRRQRGNRMWEESTQSTQIDDPAQREIHTMVEQAVRELDVIHREILLLYYFSQKDLTEIEMILGVPRETAKKRLQRARAALEANLIEKFEEVLEAYVPKKEKAGAVMGAIALAQPKWVAPAACGAGVGSLYSLWELGIMSKQVMTGLAALLAAIGIGLGVSYSALSNSSTETATENLAAEMGPEQANTATKPMPDIASRAPNFAGQLLSEGPLAKPLAARVRIDGSGASGTKRTQASVPATRSQRSSMVGGNPQHTGFYDVNAPLTSPALLWEKTFGGPGEYPGTAAAIDGAGRIFTNHGANGSNWLAALTSDGNLLWEYGPIEAKKTHAVPSVLQNGNVVQGFRDGSLVSLNPSTGDINWNTNLLHSGSSSPLVDSRDNIYIAGTSDSGVVKIDGNTGQVLWPSGGLEPDDGTRKYAISPSLSVDESTVYAAQLNLSNGEVPFHGEIIALNAADGSERWSFAPEGVGAFLKDSWAAPTVGGDATIYMQDTWSGMLYAIADHGNDAEQLWAYDPASTGVVQRFETNANHLEVYESTVYLHDAPRSVATDGDTVYLGVFGGPASVHAVNLDGSAVWRTTLEQEAIVGSPVVTSEAVYVLGAGDDTTAGHNALYCLDRDSGKILWDMPVTRPLGDTGESISLAPDGTIYLISQSISGTGVVVRALR